MSEKIVSPTSNLEDLKTIVSLFVESGETGPAIDFLRKNRESIGEFCLQVRDSYGSNDKTTAFLKLAEIIEVILSK